MLLLLEVGLVPILIMAMERVVESMQRFKRANFLESHRKHANRYKEKQKEI
jgi:hypothetical protein